MNHRVVVADFQGVCSPRGHRGQRRPSPTSRVAVSPLTAIATVIPSASSRSGTRSIQSQPAVRAAFPCSSTSTWPCARTVGLCIPLFSLHDGFLVGSHSLAPSMEGVPITAPPLSALPPVMLVCAARRAAQRCMQGMLSSSRVCAPAQETRCLTWLTSSQARACEPLWGCGRTPGSLSVPGSHLPKSTLVCCCLPGMTLINQAAWMVHTLNCLLAATAPQPRSSAASGVLGRVSVGGKARRAISAGETR